MTDTDFRQLCNVYGFAPSRALREMIDCVRAQEIEACAGVCAANLIDSPTKFEIAAINKCAAVIRARKEKT